MLIAQPIFPKQFEHIFAVTTHKQCKILLGLAADVLATYALYVSALAFVLLQRTQFESIVSHIILDD